MSMVKKRPQLSRDDLLRLRWLLGNLIALLSAWTLVFIEIEALWLVGGVTLAALAGLARPAWPARLPAWAHRLAFPAILAVFALDLYSERQPLPALLRLDLMLILYRLLMHRSRREDLQLIVLGLFLIVVAGVLTVSLAFAAQIVAFTGCALLFLFLITIAPPEPSGSGTPPWTRLRWRDVLGRLQAAVDWRLAAAATGLFAGVVLVSGLLFLAIPRFEFSSGLFLDRLINRETRSGFSDTVEFGEVTAIAQDNSLALSVDVDQPAALPAVPYWRMVVLDDYTGQGFRVSDDLRRRLALTATRMADNGTARYRAGAATWTLYLEPGVSRYLPLLGHYHRLVFTEPQTFGAHDGLRVVALQRDPARMLAYRVHGMEPAALLPDPTLAVDRRDSQARVDAFLGLPLSEADRSRLERMVAEIRDDGAPDVAAFSARASAWLAQRHRYALQNVLPPGAGDPLIRWMDSNTPGHCEYFAGSMVLLARAAGFPARLVSGFKGGSWNAYSNSFTVRAANAHAWVEVFDDATGSWRRVDPTPGADAASQLAEEAGAAGRRGGRVEEGWQARIESLRVFWYRRIVNFDQSAQRELTAVAKQAMQTGSARLRAWLQGRVEALQEWLRQPWGLRRAGAIMLIAGGGLAAGWLWFRMGRGRWLRWRSRHARAGDDPVRRQAGQWIRRLQAAGDSADRALIDDLFRLRYGDRQSWADPALVFAQARRQARRRTRRPRSSGPS